MTVFPLSPEPINPPPLDAPEQHTTTATIPSLSFFFSLSESSKFCKTTLPRFGGISPPLETPPVQGGGVELLPPFCFITKDPCFLSVQPRHRALSLCNAGKALAIPR
jgi:hypothetical protein